VLNLGHTFGHAFETFSHRVNRPVLHGYAVMWGLLCELYLSHAKFGFPQEYLLKLKNITKAYYGMFGFDCKDYEVLYELMTHDKKMNQKTSTLHCYLILERFKLIKPLQKKKFLKCWIFYLSL